jgi:hypothetical protein
MDLKMKFLGFEWLREDIWRSFFLAVSRLAGSRLPLKISSPWKECTTQGSFNNNSSSACMLSHCSLRQYLHFEILREFHCCSSIE